VNFEQLSKLIDEIPCGKSTPQAIYFHKSVINDVQLADFITKIQKALRQDNYNWNIVKFWKNNFKFSLLNYPTFDTESYPALQQSLFVDLEKKHHRLNDYSNSDNPPILHRKELMVNKDHPLFHEFSIVTQEGELPGLYDNPRTIGFKLGWEATIRNAGYELVDGRLFRASALLDQSDIKIERQKTAITRRGLSSPLKVLQKKGYLNGEYSLFDYGCGLGDDLNELQANGIDSAGWDPNFRPDAELFTADIVNLGFVLNVIEDVAERVEALHAACSLAHKMLIVSCMLTSESKLAQMTPYKDGVITSRNTFQKYYFQSELQLFIEDTLDKTAISVGPGIFIVFNDELEEQRYLSGKFKRQRDWTSLHRASNQSSKLQLLVEQHLELVESFWNTILTYGRIPASEEFDDFDRVKDIFGSPKKLFNLLMTDEKKEQFEQAKKERKEDYLVYFALELFTKKQPYRQMTEEKKRDIKSLFICLKSGREEAKELLFDIACSEQLQLAASKVCHHIPSIYNTGHSLLIQARFINDLPPILRVYVGAAAMMYGDWNEADIVKIHLTSGKVTFIVFDDFLNNPIPRMTERVKVKLAEQDIDYFDYINELKRPPLLNKHELLSERDESYADQQRLDTKLIQLGIVPSGGEQHMSITEFNGKLTACGKEIKGYRLYSI